MLGITRDELVYLWRLGVVSTKSSRNDDQDGNALRVGRSYNGLVGLRRCALPVGFDSYPPHAYLVVFAHYLVQISLEGLGPLLIDPTSNYTNTNGFLHQKRQQYKYPHFLFVHPGVRMQLQEYMTLIDIIWYLFPKLGVLAFRVMTQ
jgi:hypothetical protein